MNDSSAIDDDEHLYRKVSVKSCWYDSEREELKPLAFRPRPDDTEGLSLNRAQSTSRPKFRRIEQAAIGQSPNGYYVAILKVGDLRHQGFTVVADPIKGNPGHALLTDLTYGNRKDPQCREKMLLLAHQLVVSVEGPFNSEAG